MLIIFLGLRDAIKEHFDKKIGGQAGQVNIDKYSTVSANSICASIYSRYAYLVSLINNLPSNSEPDYNHILNIKQLCYFESLNTAIIETLDLIGIYLLELEIEPDYINKLYASNYLVNAQGYITRFSIGNQNNDVPSAYVNTMLSAIIFLQPDQSYNAPELPRFTPSVAAAQAAQMQSQYPGKVPWSLSREVSDPYPALSAPPREAPRHKPWWRPSEEGARKKSSVCESRVVTCVC